MGTERRYQHTVLATGRLLAHNKSDRERAYKYCDVMYCTHEVQRKREGFRQCKLAWKQLGPNCLMQYLSHTASDFQPPTPHKIESQPMHKQTTYNDLHQNYSNSHAYHDDDDVSLGIGIKMT
jgi:hypothetical protein